MDPSPWTVSPGAAGLVVALAILVAVGVMVAIVAVRWGLFQEATAKVASADHAEERQRAKALYTALLGRLSSESDARIAALIPLFQTAMEKGADPQAVLAAATGSTAQAAAAAAAGDEESMATPEAVQALTNALALATPDEKAEAAQIAQDMGILDLGDLAARMAAKKKAAGAAKAAQEEM